MTLEQLRAANAFAVAGRVNGEKAKFLSLARKLPEMFQTNGLLATWAFLLAKDKAEHQTVADGVLDHLRVDALHLGVPAGPDRRRVFVDHWVAPGGGLSSEGLRRLTAEAIHYAAWLKRAAEALCDDDKGATP